MKVPQSKTKLKKASKAPSEESKAFVSESKSKSTQTKPAGYGFVELFHSQEVKLSRNYQSASANYGAKIIVEDKPDAIKKGIARLEKVIETPLVEKVQEQNELLNQLA